MYRSISVEIAHSKALDFCVLAVYCIFAIILFITRSASSFLTSLFLCVQYGVLGHLTRGRVQAAWSSPTALWKRPGWSTRRSSTQKRMTSGQVTGPSSFRPWHTWPRPINLRWGLASLDNKFIYQKINKNKTSLLHKFVQLFIQLIFPLNLTGKMT